jgi:hypothetical protein
MVRNIISGEHRNQVRVVAFNTVEGWSRDISEDIANEVLDRTYDADATLGVGTKRFIDMHLTRARSDLRRSRYCQNVIIPPARRREPGIDCNVFCPGCGTSRVIDLRALDRHPLASVGTLVLGLRCS